MPVDYQLGKVYKIVSHQTEKIYIGSTCEKYLSNRLGNHRRRYTRYHKAGTGSRVSVFDLLQYGDAQIVLLESVPCNSKDQLTARERFHIENSTAPVVNKVIPFRRPEEHKEVRKIYRESHREQTRAHGRKIYHDVKKKTLIRCECGSSIMKVQQKQHRLTANHICKTTLNMFAELPFSCF